MNRIKTKYNALSKNEKIVVSSIAIVLALILAPHIYSVGEATGAAIYHWVN